jgi:AraC-like DNA-binding protein
MSRGDATPACALPTTPRMRYWKPAPALEGLVSGYHLYAVVPGPSGTVADVFQPAWPNLRFTFGEAVGWRVRQANSEWRAVPHRSLFGPTSRVTWSESGPGLTVGIGLRPCGWARLVRAEAAAWADRVGPPDRALNLDTPSLARRLGEITGDEQVPALFDEVLTEAAARGSRRGESAVAAVEAALLDPEVRTVGALAHRIGVSARSLQRLSLSAFGFTPKLLLRRARFLRSLHAVAQAEPADRAVAIDASYSDYSHFVRDAQDFLGMSPQAFLNLDTPLLKQSLALRQAVLGAPAQALASDGG